MKCYPIHFGRGMEERSIRKSSTGVWLDWQGLQDRANIKFVDSESQADAIMVFQSTPFGNSEAGVRHPETCDAGRLKGAQKTITMLKLLANSKLPILYFFCDLDHPFKNIAFKKLHKFKAVLKSYKLKDIDCNRIHVIHYCLDQDSLIRWWRKQTYSYDVPDSNFHFLNIDHAYWLKEIMKPKSDAFNIVRIGNPRRGSRNEFLSEFPGIHIYGRWQKTGVNRDWTETLPDAKFFGYVPQPESLNIINNSFGQICTPDFRQIEVSGLYLRLPMTVAAGSLPLIDSRLKYYIDHIEKTVLKRDDSLLSQLIVKNSAQVANLVLDFNTHGRLRLIEDLQDMFTEYFKKNNIKRQLNRIMKSINKR